MRMSGFNQEEFNRFILEHDIIGFFKEPIKLKSGRYSSWYVNWRGVTCDVYLTEKIADYVIAFIRELRLEPDCFYGVPEGATKLGIITQYKWAKGSGHYLPKSHPLPMGRGKPKHHGEFRDRYFLGEPQGKTIILEDVTTTGSSLLNEVINLKEMGIPLIAAVVLTDRMEQRNNGGSIAETLSEAGIPYHTMSNALDLLPKAYDKMKPGEDIAESIEKEFMEYGVEELNLR